MNLGVLGIFYALVGVGCAAALCSKSGKKFGVDTLLVLALWPLYAPFVFSKEGDEARVKASESARAPDDLLDALRRARQAPLAQLLPGEDAGQQLAQRLEVAALRVEEIDGLLSKPEYSRAAAARRQQELLDAGDQSSARMIESRLQIIERLGEMRERFSREINQISELITQLQLQAEVVRIAGSEGTAPELVDEIMVRVHSLDALLSDDELSLGGL